MNAEQIRAATSQGASVEWESARWLQEIAAQLDEANAIKRSALKLAQDQFDMNREESEKRTAQLDTFGAMQKRLTDSVAPANAAGSIPPVPLRIIPPGSPEEPRHLGCLCEMPDGSHAIYDNAGNHLPLDADQAKTLIAMLQAPPDRRSV